ncbi:MAG TPA: hypothetical protein DD416_02795, partial [Rhodobacteraceae bacterium]|nr:hypothetical protein [Paracoccaceae bacterium]
MKKLPWLLVLVVGAVAAAMTFELQKARDAAAIVQSELVAAKTEGAAVSASIANMAAELAAAK